MAGNAFTWVRKAIEIAQLPRIKLNNIQDLPGAKQKVTSFTFDSMTKIFQFQRVGRGPGSGRGKTCGRGHKGQGQRNKKAIRVGFEGGQTPFYIRVPKHGFTNKFKVNYQLLNLGWLQHLINSGRINPEEKINMYTLQQVGAVGKIKHGVKLLADGADTFTSQINIEVSKASKTAIEAVEKNGGKLITAYYNKLGLRVLLKPEKFTDRPTLPRFALPKKKGLKYYMNPENRGYLLTKEGKERLKEGGMEGSYLGEDNRIHIPGKRVTLYSPPSPPQEANN